MCGASKQRDHTQSFVPAQFTDIIKLIPAVAWLGISLLAKVNGPYHLPILHVSYPPPTRGHITCLSSGF